MSRIDAEHKGPYQFSVGAFMLLYAVEESSDDDCNGSIGQIYRRPKLSLTFIFISLGVIQYLSESNDQVSHCSIVLFGH